MADGFLSRSAAEGGDYIVRGHARRLIDDQQPVHRFLLYRGAARSRILPGLRSLLPGIKEVDSEVGEIFHIAGDKSEIVMKGSRCEHTIDYRRSIAALFCSG